MLPARTSDLNRAAAIRRNCCDVICSDGLRHKVVLVTKHFFWQSFFSRFRVGSLPRHIPAARFRGRRSPLRGDLGPGRGGGREEGEETPQGREAYENSLR